VCVSLFLKVRQCGEVFLTRLGLVLIPYLPRSWILALATALGHAAYACSSHLRKVGRVNLDLAFGQSLSRKDKRRILKTSFRTFALVMLDIFWFTHKTRERLAKYVSVDPAMEGLVRKRPRICVTAHLGNWELLGQACMAHGVNLISVAAPLANPVVDAIFIRFRKLMGQQVLPREGALRGVLNALRSGDNVGMLLDQNTKPSEGGVFVQFFGMPVPISAAGASLALRTNAEIVFGFCVPRPDGGYHVRVPARFTPALRAGEDPKSAVARITQDIAAVIETEIRNNPGFWLWTYKRWKYVGPGRDRSEYPFYAKILNPGP